jgi:hypothetical protein
MRHLFVAWRIVGVFVAGNGSFEPPKIGKHDDFVIFE